MLSDVCDEQSYIFPTVSTYSVVMISLPAGMLLLEASVVVYLLQGHVSSGRKVSMNTGSMLANRRDTAMTCNSSTCHNVITLEGQYGLMLTVAQCMC